jgi:hypothetical protein
VANQHTKPNPPQTHTKPAQHHTKPGPNKVYANPARLLNPGTIVVHLSLEKQKPFTCNTNRAGAYYKLLGFCFSLQLITVLFFDMYCSLTMAPCTA